MISSASDRSNYFIETVLEKNYVTFLSTTDSSKGGAMEDPEGVQGVCSNPLPAPVFKYLMKMK